MGSLEALEVYWTSAPALAALTAFLLLGLAVTLAYRTAHGNNGRRLRLLRTGTWLSIGFWTFVSASLVLCLLLADPIEYGVATVKVVTVLSISSAVGVASVVAWAVSGRVPARTRNLPPGGWAPEGTEIHGLVSRIAGESGMAHVRVRTVPGPPLACTEPPDTVVVSQGLLKLLSEQELEAVILHELCHLVERDGPKQAFTAALSRLLFFDPFLRVLNRASSRGREYRADEWTAERMGAGVVLASALAKVAPTGISAPGLPGPGRERGLGHPCVEDRLVRLRP